jgi:hypothetical protein
MKHCNKCDRDKPLPAFARNKQTPDGLQAYCKECNRAYREANIERINYYAAEYRAAPHNREKHVAYCKQYYAENSDYFKRETKRYRDSLEGRIVRHDRELRDRYGITHSDYEGMLTAQHGHCAICPNTPPANGWLSVDHCHATGEVRGLLCNKCNLGLGLLGDCLEGISSAYSYLAKHVRRKSA